eukprot:128678-Hanusia_phi.AAC.1
MGAVLKPRMVMRAKRLADHLVQRDPDQKLANEFGDANPAGRVEEEHKRSLSREQRQGQEPKPPGQRGAKSVPSSRLLPIQPLHPQQVAASRQGLGELEICQSKRARLLLPHAIPQLPPLPLEAAPANARTSHVEYGGGGAGDGDERDGEGDEHGVELE